MKYLKLYEDFTTKKFYLVIDDYRKLLNNDDFLKHGHLKGLQGISSNPDIYDSLGTQIEAFITMDSKDVLKHNDLTKVLYDDVNFLVSDNFKYLKRILFLSNDTKEFYDLIFTKHHNLYALKEYNEEVFNLLKNTSSNVKKDIQNINNIKDICDYILRFENYDYDTLYKSIEFWIKFLASDYRYEEEYVINNENFHIPFNSFIEFKHDEILDDKGEKQYQIFIKKYNNFKKDFSNRYTIS